MNRHHSAPAVRVQPESRFRVSGETDGRAAAYVRAAHLAESQKRALHVSIHKSAVATKAIAEDCGIGYAFLCDAANTSRRDQLPFARLPLLLEACDDLTLLRFYAHLAGCEVVRLPGVCVHPDDLHRASATMREFAEFMEASADALQDLVVSPEEFAVIEREGREAVRAILESIEAQRARVRKPLLEAL